jgi:hypothetical protein
LILPTNEEGIVEVEQHRIWLTELQQLENPTFMPTPSSTAGSGVLRDDVVTPTKLDALMGRGRVIEGNPGNGLLQRIVASHFGPYQNTSTSRIEKAMVFTAVYVIMKDSGSRFLKKEDEDWIEVAEVAAKQNISHTFRNYKAREASSQLHSTGTADDSEQESLSTEPSRCFF